MLDAGEMQHCAIIDRERGKNEFSVLVHTKSLLWTAMFIVPSARRAQGTMLSCIRVRP